MDVKWRRRPTARERISEGGEQGRGERTVGLGVAARLSWRMRALASARGRRVYRLKTGPRNVEDGLASPVTLAHCVRP